MAKLAIAVALIALNGPSAQIIWVNPSEIVSIRAPRETKAEHFGPGIQCVIQTVDGKLINVTDDCDVVRQKVGLGAQ